MQRPLTMWEAARSEAEPGFVRTATEREREPARPVRRCPGSLAGHWFKAMHNAAEGVK